MILPSFHLQRQLASAYEVRHVQHHSVVLQKELEHCQVIHVILEFGIWLAKRKRQAHCRVVGIIVGFLAGADLSSSQLTDPYTNWYKSTSVTPGSFMGLCMPSSLLLATHCGSRVDYSPDLSWLQHARMSTLSHAQPSTSCISFIMKLLSPPLAWRGRILSAVSAFQLRTSPLGSRAAQVPPLLGDAVNPQYVQRAAGLHPRVPTHGAHPRS